MISSLMLSVYGFPICLVTVSIRSLNINVSTQRVAVDANCYTTYTGGGGPAH